MKKFLPTLLLTFLAAQVSFAQSDLVITEIMYNPPEAGTDSLEFIEIYNKGSIAINVNNYTCTGGTYTFPNTSIAPGAYYVIAVDMVAFNNVYGLPADGQFTNGLNNGGEDIVLKDDLGNVIDSVEYNDASPWPAGNSAGEPDGGGASLILCDENTDNNDGNNWQASSNSVGATINGFSVLASPGVANSCTSCTPTFGIDPLTACDSLTWTNGVTYYADNFTAKDTLVNAAGCDSIVTLDLAVNYSNSGTDTRTECDSLVWIDSNTYYTDNNTATFIVTNYTGCDSLVTLDLTIVSSPTVTISVFHPDTICSTDAAVALPSGSPSGGVYSGNGVGGGMFDPSIAGVGTHTVYYSVTDTNSCTGIDSTTITVETCTGVSTNYGLHNISVQPNPTNKDVFIELGKNYKKIELELYNSLGQIIVANNYNNLSKLRFEIPDKAGVYFVRLKLDDKQVETIRVIKN